MIMIIVFLLVIFHQLIIYWVVGGCSEDIYKSFLFMIRLAHLNGEIISKKYLQLYVKIIKIEKINILI
jgi:hypothetical protein